MILCASTLLFSKRNAEANKILADGKGMEIKYYEVWTRMFGLAFKIVWRQLIMHDGIMHLKTLFLKYAIDHFLRILQLYDTVFLFLGISAHVAPVSNTSVYYKNMRVVIFCLKLS